ncbi:MAG: neocarzinostatin apoprotein domain-containing protein, partial [Ilumatobacteraceae bacterium]
MARLTSRLGSAARLTVAVGLAAMVAVAPGTAGASPDGPLIEIDPESPVPWGSTVEVTLTGFLPDVEATVLLCHEETLGPTSCDIAGAQIAPVESDGSAIFEYTFQPSAGYTCDECFLVIIDRIPPSTTAVLEVELTGEPGPAPTTTLASVGGNEPLGDPELVVEPFEELSQDDMVTVVISGFAPGVNVTLSQCQVYPVAGPADCDLSRFGQDVVTTDAEGAATYDYRVDAGEVGGAILCTDDSPCHLVASDGIGADSVSAGHTLAFASAAPPATEPPATEPPATEPPATEPPATEPPATE